MVEGVKYETICNYTPQPNDRYIIIFYKQQQTNITRQ